MTGAVLGAICGFGGAGDGTTAPPDTLAWSNIFAVSQGATQSLRITGVGGGSTSLTASNSGGSRLFYTRNTASIPYSGAFNVSDGDMIGWWLLNISSVNESGTVVISSGSFIISTFTYLILGNEFY